MDKRMREHVGKVCFIGASYYWLHGIHLFKQWEQTKITMQVLINIPFL